MILLGGFLNMKINVCSGLGHEEVKNDDEF